MSNEDPSLLKTWEFSLNTFIVGDSATVDNTLVSRQGLMFAIKSKMTGGTSSFSVPWVVQQSSNGSVADASDNWATQSDVKWGNDSSGPSTVSRSWIVLHNAVLGVYLLLDCSQGSSSDRGSEIDAYVSPDVYNIDGTTTSRPTTSGTELQICDRLTSDNGSWEGNASSATARTYVMHAWMSSDGEETRIAVVYNGVCTALWVIGRITDPSVAPDHDFFVSLSPKGRNTTELPTITQWNTELTTNLKWFVQRNDNTIAGASILGASVDENGWKDSYGKAANAYDGRRSLQEFVLSSEESGWAMVIGKVPDMWWGPSQGGSTSKTWPDTREYIQMGDALLPWDGSTTPIP
jgi:hypothetical protein